MARDRNEKGQFVKGYKGGPGRPPRATEQEYLDAVADTVPLSRFIRMVEKQAQRAERGDIRAFEGVAKLLRLYVERQEINGGDKPLVIQYVNNWRDKSTVPASGSDSG